MAFQWVPLMVVVATLGRTAADLCQPESTRQECGFPGITPEQCHQKGCCFDNSDGDHWCSKSPQKCKTGGRSGSCGSHGSCAFGNTSTPDQCHCDSGYSGPRCENPPPPANYSTITTVHVINSCHLDIGFADSSVGIMNRYFDHHFPMAVTVGAALRAAPGAGGRAVPDRLNFMFQSWVVSMYLDCPTGMGLHCPTTAQASAFEGAIKAGDVTWHAFPHNAELEMIDPSLIEAGLALTWALDDRFGLPRKQTLSQRDVPGMTRSLIPLLTKAGVTAISIGANDGSTAPSVPKIFKWTDTTSNTSILGIFNWPGYGSVGNGPVFVKGTTHALVYNWNGDNAGPSSVAAYQSTFAKLATTFPNARIVPSTFDNFTQHLLPLLDNTDSVPNLEVEMGDTWVYGVPSDPQKLARMRVINRAWRDESARWPGGSVLAEGNSLTADPVLLNATRFALKLGEHTWGRDVKSNLVDNTDWKNPDFYKAKRPPAKTAPQYETLEDSWWEQRHWGITLAVDTLVDGRHRMAAGLVAEMEALKPELPVPADGGGFVKAAAGTPYTCGGEQVQFNAAGALTRLGKWVASDKRAVLQLKYRQYSAADVDEFFAQYCKSNAGWVQHDYGKPDLPSDVPGRISAPTLSMLWKKSAGAAGDCDFVAELAFDPTASTDCGAPETAFVNISIFPGVGGADSIADVTMGLFNKTQTRLPEAMFLQFTPSTEGGGWEANKLGEWVSSTDIVDGGTKHLHGVSEQGLRYTNGNNTLSISSLDAGVANFGNLTAYPSPVHTDADVEAFGSSFVLWDNLWGTNYIMWWPFEQPPPQEYSSSSKYFPEAWNSDMVSRYQLRWTSA